MMTVTLTGRDRSRSRTSCRRARTRPRRTLPPLHVTARRAARAVVDRLAQSDAAVYGVNTALGANTGQPIPASERAAYQQRAVLARAVGVGPPFPVDVVRATMFARAAGMAVGRLGRIAGRARHADRDAERGRASGRAEPGIDRRGGPARAVASRAADAGIGRGRVRGTVLPGADAMAGGIAARHACCEGRTRADQRQRGHGRSRGARARRLRGRARRAERRRGSHVRGLIAPT